MNNNAIAVLVHLGLLISSYNSWRKSPHSDKNNQHREARCPMHSCCH